MFHLILGLKNEKFGCSDTMTFVADTMLGKLSRWLRILGYDTVYDATMTLEQLALAAESSESMFLTRRTKLPAKTVFRNVIFIPHEKFEDQLRFIVERCNLQISGTLFTRCLTCNTEVIRIPKDRIQGKVPHRTFDGTNEFFICPHCNNIYWSGAHYRNTVNKLDRILNTNH
jgi:uncharacterized protein with PIN domain